jgi:hypothetical protein
MVMDSQTNTLDIKRIKFEKPSWHDIDYTPHDVGWMPNTQAYAYDDDGYDDDDDANNETQSLNEFQRVTK